MARFGFIRTKDEIKFLILTCMTYLPFPVTFAAIVDICTWCDDGFGYFELSEAFSELQDSQHVEKSTENDTELFAITEKGRETAQAFQSKLRRDAQVSAETEQISEKDYVVTMTMQDVFSIQMHVVSQTQAAYLEQHFQKHAEDVYQHLLSTMTSEYETE